LTEFFAAWRAEALPLLLAGEGPATTLVGNVERMIDADA
jgi:hypothetical protein